ncbi:MAG: DUF3597 domain-containing protein [Pseudorhodoplanes sp.]
MSIFGKILSAIGLGSGSAAGTASSAAPSGGAAMAQVDVEKVVSGLAAQKKEKLDWHKSIVDLMKVLDLDSSLKNRQELAKELGYTGDMNDSAKMNIWLHKQVMTKLAENGGKVPDSLKA